MYPYIHIGNASEIADKSDYRLYRFFEILPGLLSWATLAFVIWISFAFPLFAAVFIIVFDIYWLIKTIYLSLLMRATFNKMRANLKINWTDRLETLKWEEIYHLVILPMSRSFP